MSDWLTGHPGWRATYPELDQALDVEAGLAEILASGDDETATNPTTEQ
ncbi:hypothetical protein ACH4N4_30165 [Streptomyces microflavus]